MAISGIENINIGLQNEAAGSDSLYTAFHKSQNNFTTLFSCASPTTNFVAGNGVSVEYSNSNTYLTITNTGVTNLVAGDDSIVLTQSNGNVTITAPGGGNGGGGVSNINVIGAAAGARITSTGGPIISNGIITLDLASSGVIAGTYTYPTVTVDQYGRVTNIVNASSAGTVTSVGVTTTGVGIQVSGSPITGAGNISIINTGVTRLNAGTGISLSSSNGNITVSMTTSGAGVTSVGLSSTTLDVTNSPVTSTGTMTVNLPNNTSIVGNLSVGNNLTVTGSAVVTGNLTVQGNTTYYNVETFNVEDPIITLGGGPNGNALTSNDGKDRGTALQYYTSAPVTAFMGWDNSNSEFSFGSNVSISSEVVTFTTLGNVRGLTWLGNVVGTTANLTTGNITTGNITTINSSLMQNGNSNVSITANANVSIAVTGANRLVITSTGANITGTGNFSGNLNAANLIGPLANGNSNVNIAAANGNITLTAVGTTTMTITGTGANITGTANITGNLSAGNIPIIASGNSNITITSNANISMFTAGNATAQLVVTSTGANITGTANVSGNLSVANSITSGYIIASVASGITAAGTAQANATALTKDINQVSTNPTGAGVVLPSAVAGMRITVKNYTANTLNVYPAANGIISTSGTGTVNAAVALGTYASNTFVCYSATPSPGGSWFA